MTTGYVYDEVFLKHDMPGHPENRQRLEAIMGRLAESGALQRLVHIPARPATPEELERAHHPRYVDSVQAMAKEAAAPSTRTPTSAPAPSMPP